MYLALFFNLDEDVRDALQRLKAHQAKTLARGDSISANSVNRRLSLDSKKIIVSLSLMIPKILWYLDKDIKRPIQG